MTKWLLVGVVMLQACAAAPPVIAPSDPRIVVTPTVSGNLGVSAPSVSQLPDGRMRVVLNVQNPQPTDFPLRIQTEWLDASGAALSTAAARPQFRSVARNTVTTLDADAPSPRARDFRMTLDVEGN